MDLKAIPDALYKACAIVWQLQIWPLMKGIIGICEDGIYDWDIAIFTLLAVRMGKLSNCQRSKESEKCTDIFKSTLFSIITWKSRGQE